MMSELAVRVEGLGKKYRLGTNTPRYRSLRENMMNVLAAPLRRLRGRGAGSNSEFWALRDVSFDVHRGDAVGIIGRNGAGKSTLLRILSRITGPTTGRVRLRGRVGSLLEVGTGFHPELSGRENIYLNGAILGMARAEIAGKFDEIVAFAEIEKFLDTPVKRYSSGMYMRLAFAVAAHLEPEILVVDEVLAVGDAEFQKKCLGKMSEVSQGGRTVLFVSHNMSAITRLCKKAILLDKGQVKQIGDASAVATNYLASDLGTSAERRWSDPKTAPGDATARLKAVRILCNGVVTDTIDIRMPLTIEMEFWNLKSDARLLAAFSFFDEQGVFLFVSGDWANCPGMGPMRTGVYRAQCTIPGNLFSESQIRVVAEVATHHPVYELHILEYDSVGFQVVEPGQPGSVRAGWGRPLGGAVRPKLDWEPLQRLES